MRRSLTSPNITVASMEQNKGYFTGLSFSLPALFEPFKLNVNIGIHNVFVQEK